MYRAISSAMKDFYEKNLICCMRLSLTIELAIILVLALTLGCPLIPGIGDDSENSADPYIASISGKVLKPSVPTSMRRGVNPNLATADMAGSIIRIYF